MHSKGVVNQNFHAGNVLLSQDGQTLIKTDLGKAAWTETDGQPTFLDRCWQSGSPQPSSKVSCLNTVGFALLALAGLLVLVKCWARLHHVYQLGIASLPASKQS